MKVSEIKIENFKRFKNLKIAGLPQEAKLVIIVGPNGSGKSSLFDAFHHWYKRNVGFGRGDDEVYYRKEKNNAFDWTRNVNISFHDESASNAKRKQCMYFRTAYRNDPDFNISNFTRPGAPQDSIRFNRLIDNDQAVGQNYQRLLYNTLSGVYSVSNDQLTVKQLREELIGKVRKSMKAVFDDLILNNVGDPLGDGAFYFEKGTSKSYHYKNLSGGEKSAFDLLLDLIIKIEYYDNTVFLIDEPDSHMHTSLQGRLVKELFNIIPENSQLWLTTHSLGVMRAARDIEKDSSDKTAILDFDGYNFDEDCIISPVKIDRVIWEKFLSIALDDFSTRIAPEAICLCEGSLNGSKRKNFDADIYNLIFGNEYPHISFISGGSCADLEKDDHPGHSILQGILKSTHIYRLLDRDDKSTEEIVKLRDKGFFVLKRRHIESYLFDDEVIKKLVIKKAPNSVTIAKQLVSEKVPEINDKLELFFETAEENELKFKLNAQGFIEKHVVDEGQRKELLSLWQQSSESKISEALNLKQSAINNSKGRGNPEDDIKSASGEIYNGLKSLLSLTQCGNNTEAFMRDTLVVSQ